MVTEAKGLESLKELKVPHNIQDVAVERVALEDVKPIVDEFGRSYGTGKRKNAVARVWIKPGKGKITVNGKDFNKYFARPAYQIQVEVPFKIIGREKMFDVVATVTGGGLTGQSEAIRHGISKALTYFEPMLRIPLKKAGLLTRDSRVVERKKYGLHKARRSTQFSKR